MLTKWAALSFAMIAPTIPLSDNTPSNEVIQKLEANFWAKVEQIIEYDFDSVLKDIESIDDFVWFWCRVDKILQSSSKDYHIRTVKYKCEDIEWKDIEFNAAQVVSKDLQLSFDERCSDISVFFSDWNGDYEYWYAAWIKKRNFWWKYELDYYYTNTSCSEVSLWNIPMER